MQTKSIPQDVLEQILSESFQIRFWDKVDIKSPNECWNWKASRVYRDGYGQMGVWCNGKRHTFKSHKLAWVIKNRSDVPNKLLVLHSCVGNKGCCNPAHLRPGTKTDNAMDMVMQGRANPRMGESCGVSKFTNYEIVLMRKKHSSGLFTIKSLAKEFNMTAPNARSIIRRETWKHI